MHDLIKALRHYRSMRDFHGAMNPKTLEAWGVVAAIIKKYDKEQESLDAALFV